MPLLPEERPQHPPFWDGEVEDGTEVNALLGRRFPRTYELLSASLDEADPCCIVYPGNPGEYTDVVNEVIVLLAPENADLTRVGRGRLHAVVREGFARCFPDDPEEPRIARAVELILAGVGGSRSETVAKT